MVKFCRRESSMRNVRESKLDEIISSFKSNVNKEEMTPLKK